MILDMFLIAIALIALIIASVTDFKKREIPDFLSYSLLSIAIFSKILQSIIEKALIHLIYAAIGFSIFFIIALIMYHAKQWGGGDSKMLMSLGIIFSEYPKEFLNYLNPNLNIPILLSLFINILLIGSVYGVLFSSYLAIKNKERFIKEFKNANKKNLKYYLIISLITLIFSFLISNLTLKLLILALSLWVLLIPYLLLFTRTVEKSCMIKNIQVSKLTEGDWITENIYSKNKIIYSSKSLGITKRQIQDIKRLNIKEVTIKEGIPFVPSFLIAFITTLIYGNVIFFI